MPAGDQLSEAGLNAIAQNEAARREAAARRQAAAEDALQPKSYELLNAETGSVLLRDGRGGRAYVEAQGSLTNGAIAEGEPVSAYRWKAADWMPAQARDSNTLLGEAALLDTGTGSDLDGETEPEPGPDPEHCTSQLLCYRGVGYADPGEPAAAQACPFLGGQCSTPYRLTYTINNSQTYTTVLTGPLSAPELVYAGTNALTGPCSGENFEWRVSHAGGIYKLNLLGSTARNGNSAPECQPPDFVPTAVSITRVDGLPDDCGDLAACPGLLPYDPPVGSDPEEWRSICSPNPPINYTADTNSDRSLITVTDSAGELAKLDFEPNQYQIKVACKEDGCDTADNCETNRLWVRTSAPPAPGQCPVQYRITVNARVKFDPQNFGKPDLFRNVNWTSFVFNGPVNPAWYFELPSTSVGSNRNSLGWHVGTLRKVSAPNVAAVNFPSLNSAPRIQMPSDSGYRVQTVSINSETIVRVDGLPDTCPEAEPGTVGPWETAGPLSFNPPIQVDVSIDGATGEHTLTIYDAESTIAEPLGTVSFPDANYEYAVRCTGDGAPTE